MTESSYLWTTSTTGDGTSTYTQNDTSNFSKILAACAGFEGVAPNYLNTLTITGASSPVSVNTGGAVVDGKPYLNSASVSVSIPTPVTYSRIDRVVLRADWSAHTVRITKIAGTEAASPTAPAITQTPGTTYDIKLYQVLITTGGAITLTDERVYAQIAPVSQSLIVPIVPNFVGRQGGDTTDWSVDGSSNYTPTSVSLQAGVTSTTTSTANTGGGSVTFPTAFATSKAPVVILTVELYGSVSSDIVTIENESPAYNGFSYRWKRSGSTSNLTLRITWIAIGPP